MGSHNSHHSSYTPRTVVRAVPVVSCLSYYIQFNSYSNTYVLRRKKYSAVPRTSSDDDRGREIECIWTQRMAAPGRALHGTRRHSDTVTVTTQDDLASWSTARDGARAHVRINTAARTNIASSPFADHESGGTETRRRHGHQPGQEHLDACESKTAGTRLASAFSRLVAGCAPSESAVNVVEGQTIGDGRARGLRARVRAHTCTCTTCDPISKQVTTSTPPQERPASPSGVLAAIDARSRGVTGGMAALARGLSLALSSATSAARLVLWSNPTTTQNSSHALWGSKRSGRARKQRVDAIGGGEGAVKKPSHNVLCAPSAMHARRLLPAHACSPPMRLSPPP